MLARLDDGGCTVTDLGSTNGTELNEGEMTLEPGQAHRLVDGDRIHVGAWTTITSGACRREPGSATQSSVAAIRVVGPSWPGMSTTSSW